MLHNTALLKRTRTRTGRSWRGVSPAAGGLIKFVTSQKATLNLSPIFLLLFFKVHVYLNVYLLALQSRGRYCNLRRTLNVLFMAQPDFKSLWPKLLATKIFLLFMLMFVSKLNTLFLSSISPTSNMKVNSNFYKYFSLHVLPCRCSLEKLFR